MTCYEKMYVVCEDEYLRLMILDKEIRKPKTEETVIDNSNTQPPIVNEQVIVDVPGAEINQSERRKYVCKTCGKVYIDKRSLRRHNKTHVTSEQVIVNKIIEKKNKIRQKRNPFHTLVHDKVWMTID